MSARSTFGRLAAAAGVTLTLSVLSAGVSRAQMWDNPALPRSPYALPRPVDRPTPDVDDLIEGNGQLHSSGQWRHWGDSRNSGEIAYDLLAPQAEVAGPRQMGEIRRRRFCDFHPERC